MQNWEIPCQKPNQNSNQDTKKENIFHSKCKQKVCVDLFGYFHD